VISRDFPQTLSKRDDLAFAVSFYGNHQTLLFLQLKFFDGIFGIQISVHVF